MRVPALCLLLCAVLLSGCLNPQEALFQCTTAADCPSGWDCQNAVCVDPTCTSEDKVAFCSRLHLQCGSFSAPDNCGRSQTFECGTCPAEQSCEMNQCRVPGVDGGPADGGLDAGPVDAGPDAGPADGGLDAGPVDGGPDAGPLDGGPADAGPTVTSISINPAVATMEVGETLTFTAEVKFSDGRTVPNATVAWGVSSAALSVGTTGLVTALQTGSGDVIASTGGVQKRAAVTVEEASKISIAGGDHQTGTVQSALPEAMKVFVHKANGSPLPAETVVFAAPVGGSIVGLNASVTTDPLGNAQVGGVLGTVPGLQTFTATWKGKTVSFTQTAQCATDQLACPDACVPNSALNCGTCAQACAAGLECRDSGSGFECQSLCHSDADCSSSAPLCNPETQHCEQCRQTSDCSGDRICTNGSCELCSNPQAPPLGMDCRAGGIFGGNNICNLPPLSSGGSCDAAGKCCEELAPTGCTTDDDCVSVNGAPHCSLSGSCVECVTNSECHIPGTVCKRNACVTGSSGGACLSQNDCMSTASTPQCDTTRDTCVQCLSTADCHNGTVCESGACRVPIGGVCAGPDCAAGLSCRSFGTDHICTRDCTRDEECDPEGTHQSICAGVCLARCTVDGDCRGSGEICRSIGASAPACTPDCRGQEMDFCASVFGYPSVTCSEQTGTCGALGTCGSGVVCPAGQACLLTATPPQCVNDCRGGLPAATCGDGRECQSGVCDQGQCRSCPAGMVCGAAGTCAECGSGRTACGDSCLDLNNDANNCGACGQSCGARSLGCSDGICQCNPSDTYCPGNTCLDVRSDPQNCGDCGHMCPAGLSCRSGACLPECSEDRDCVAGRFCAGDPGRCVDCRSDGDCRLGELCQAGTCEDIAGPLRLARWELPCLGSLSPTTCATSDMPTRTLNLGGQDGSVYDVKFHFVGAVESRNYAGGCNTDGTSWLSGGIIDDALFSVFRLETASLPQTFFLNAGTPVADYLQVIDFEQTLRLEGGAALTLTALSRDGEQVINRDIAGTPISIPSATIQQPYSGQFIEMSVVSVARAPSSEPLACAPCVTTAECASGSVCSSSHHTCEACPSGTLVCGGSCVDLLSSHDNCGSCGNACAPNALCLHGGCLNGCTSDAYCPPGESCNAATGYCSGGTSSGPAAGTVGAACLQNSDCNSGACLDETHSHFSGGYCSQGCTSDAECPSGSLCVQQYDIAGNPVSMCLQSCAGNAECRPAYNCTTQEGKTVCLNQCLTDLDCPDTRTQTCNPFTGLCSSMACSGDGSCSGIRPYCAPGINACVECNNDAQCVAGETCVNHICDAHDGCSDLVTCLQACSDGNCQQACFDATSPQGQSAYRALVDCIYEACPMASTCIDPGSAICAECQQSAQTGTCQDRLIACLSD